jgi:hypothetical protein
VSKFKDSEHLLRLAAVFIVGILIFVVLRSQFVPKSFGKAGHYRYDALAEIESRPVVYAGHQACEDCHSDIVKVKTDGKHAHVNCEACHGPAENHVQDPASVKPTLPDTKVLCARCHAQVAGRPATFPQVDIKEHSGGEACKTCHQPHSPLLQTGAAK